MAEPELEEGQIVLCTVDKIVGTTVFVQIEGNGLGTITTSEISPGRIRNLRAYVTPNKKIVCKILYIKGDHIHLSLRRVKQFEKKELLDKIKKEKNLQAILKTVLGAEQAEKAIGKITNKQTIVEFFDEVKQNSQTLEREFSKEQAEKILKILETKKEKPKEIKQILTLSSKSPNGIIIVKEIMQKACKNSECSISYIAAGKYRLGIQGKDFKELKTKTYNILQEIEIQAKDQNCEFSVEKG